jgi:3',5'-cyclic AMP phosphodiesterase CpdA
MKKTFLALMLLAFSCSWHGVAQNLQFNAKGKFKIVQLTDVHYIHEDPRSEISLKNIDEVMKEEKPDLVMITGDVIYGKPARESLCDVLDRLSKYKVPFAVTFGNHDDEQGLSRRELLDILESYPMNLTATTEGLPGVSNYVLPVAGEDGRTAAVLYCFDSHSYSRIKGIGGYDYIKAEQIAWYKEKRRQSGPSVAVAGVLPYRLAGISRSRAQREHGTRGNAQGARLLAGPQLRPVCGDEGDGRRDGCLCRARP